MYAVVLRVQGIGALSLSGRAYHFWQPISAAKGRRLPLRPPTLEMTQGQRDGFFSQLPFKCFLPEQASVGDRLEICPWVASRVVMLLHPGLHEGRHTSIFTCFWKSRALLCHKLPRTAPVIIAYASIFSSSYARKPRFDLLM